LSIWWNRATALSELLVHDAADLRRIPLARVKLPARIPFGFHGNWADAATLDKAIAAQPEIQRPGPRLGASSRPASISGASPPTPAAQRQTPPQRALTRK
jgi:hypothetical protein